MGCPQGNPSPNLSAKGERSQYKTSKRVPLRQARPRYSEAQAPHPSPLPEGAREQYKLPSLWPASKQRMSAPSPPAGGEGWGEGSPRSHTHLRKAREMTRRKGVLDVRK